MDVVFVKSFEVCALHNTLASILENLFDMVCCLTDKFFYGCWFLIKIVALKFIF